MSGWLMVGLWGGLVGLDSTSFPQFMIARPVIAGTLTGAIFGRPVEGVMLGFLMEAFALVTLPIGAARFPESGTATVAGISAYMAAVETGLDPGALTLALAFALVWERVTGASVMLLRRNNGRVLALAGAMKAEELERRHLGAMTMDYLRAALVSVVGGLLGYALLTLVADAWALPDGATLGMLTVLAATMLGTTLSLFGGPGSRRYAWGLGLAVGLALLTVL